MRKSAKVSQTRTTVSRTTYTPNGEIKPTEPEQASESGSPFSHGAIIKKNAETNTNYNGLWQILLMFNIRENDEEQN